jgi:uncharacterized membrane protein
MTAVIDRGSTQSVSTTGWGQPLFAIAMIGLGIVGFAVGDVAMTWQRIPIENMPGKEFVAYLCALIELLGGIALLVPSLATIASRVLFAFTAAWLLLLKLPSVVAVPTMEATWLGFGEIAVVAAGACVLFATHSSDRSTFLRGRGGVRNARILFAVALPMIGLSHFVYADETVKFIPAYFPFPYFWAYLTGAASIATCVAILSGVLARLAATLEAAMLVVVTVAVWSPGLAPSSFGRLQITAFLMSSVIAVGAWIVADSYRGSSWTARQAP